MTGTGSVTRTSKSTKMMLVSMMHSRSTSKKGLKHLSRIHMMCRMKIVAGGIVIIMMILINILASIIGGFFASIRKDGVGFIDFFEFGFMVSFFSIGSSYMSIWNDKKLHQVLEQCSFCTASQKILKRPGQKKKSVKSNKSISRNLFLTIFHKNYTSWKWKISK